MSNAEVANVDERLLRPLVHTSKAFYAFVIALLAIVIWAGYAWYVQLTNGLAVTGMRAVPGGAPWGLYTVTFIFFIGITHPGIATSAAVRILNLKTYRPVMRMAELLTLVCLVLAIMLVILDLGRPDRLFNTLLYYPKRIGSPLIWDLTAIVTYLILGSTYLYLPMRKDLAICLKVGPQKWQWFYKLLLPLYRPGEEKAIERISWWMAVAILPVMVFVHSTVGWLFGLIAARPGWYGAVLGPYYVTGAVLSGIATLVVAAAAIRWRFEWGDVLKPEIFRGLGNFLAVVAIIYLYFVTAEHLTYSFGGTAPEFVLSEALLVGGFMRAFWFVVVAGLWIPFMVLFTQAVRRKALNIPLTTISAFLIVVALWINRYLIVVPPLLHPSFARPPEIYNPSPWLGNTWPWGTYTPTWVEWSIISGAFALGILLYTLFLKVFPIVELGRSE